MEGGAYENQVAFSRKELNPEQKVSFGGMGSSLGGKLSGKKNAGGVSKNADIANVKISTDQVTHHVFSKELCRTDAIRCPPIINKP